MDDDKSKKRTISPLILVNAFIRSEQSKQYELTSVDCSLLYSIMSYIGMSDNRICYAARKILMNDSRIKNNTRYSKHLKILNDKKLIKSIKKKGGKDYHVPGENINQFENKYFNNTGTSKVPVEGITGTLEVPPQVPLRYQHTIYKELEINTRSITIAHRRSRDLSKRSKNAQKESCKNYNHESDERDKTNSVYSETTFKLFLTEYPKHTAYAYQEIFKHWQENNLDKISSIILEDIKDRKTLHSQWLDALKEKQLNFIPDPLNYLKRQLWHTPIIPKSNINNGGQSHESNNRQKYSRADRLQERLSQEYIESTNTTNDEELEI